MKLVQFAAIFFLLSRVVYAEPASPFTLEETTIAAVQKAILKQQLTCEQLVTAYIQRIKQYNLSVTDKPPINAFTMINPFVLDEARQLDASFAKTHQLAGSLHCVPVVIKDNIDSFDTTTSSGSFAMLGSQPNQDAELVTRLRQAGAIVLGKTAMDEFAWGMIGISSRSGRVGNAYDTTQNPGGSSSGTGAAVSANFALVGIGTDNSGSVRIPAAFNGLIGLRPSTGLISQHGIFPMGNLDGTAGPMARTVTDLAQLLDVIAEPTQRDKSYSAHLNPNGLKGKRIGVVHWVGKSNVYNKMPQDVQQVIQTALQTMEQQGATVIREINLKKFDNNRELNQSGEIEDVNAYLAAFPAARKSFRDICESDRTRTFGSVKKCLDFMDKTAKKSSKQYQQVLVKFAKNKKYIEDIMQKNQLDALLLPITTNGSATYDAMTVNTWRASVSSNSGMPSIEIPVGYKQADGMPIGVEFVGKQFAEATLIEIAYGYEQHGPQRRVPILAPANNKLADFSIAQLNNLFSVLGQRAYDQVLKNKSPDDLTPARFKEIAAKVIDDETSQASTH